MASSIWSAIESGTSGMASVSDPAAMLNQQLASALSTMGDAQYWEESIAPSAIRQSFAESDPSNPIHIHALLRAMKWLLASISKGRDVSDFYPHVVKCVAVVSLEVRKMVYMYLVQYADHDATTRELSLLSINAFQRGLADSEQLIRALALRVLTSIRIADVVQIQVLGIQKCAHDTSPYVRKCAANALAKLNPRCTDPGQREMLLEMMKDMLDHDEATMVLTSALVAFTEICPERLDLLHTCFRKVCHLLTDMDEWGQAIVIDLLARYCRQYFREPHGWRNGTAEQIDRVRRVRRTLQSGVMAPPAPAQQQQALHTPDDDDDTNNNNSTSGVGGGSSTSNHQFPAANRVAPSLADQAAQAGVVLPSRGTHPSVVPRRVVKKGFYSDEEDESAAEEHVEPTYSPHLASAVMPLNSPFRSPDGSSGAAATLSGSSGVLELDEEAELAPDHRTLMQSAMPLLKSRNAGVVLAVCSLQYYCGVSSVKVRAAMGKALVRIHRSHREIQYVVLSSIRTLAIECPSAFTPFLQDFFVKAIDPPFTRLIKLDILTSLALEPAAIDVVLTELRTYVRHSDQAFACASIRAVGRAVEMARIVYDRHGAKIGKVVQERAEANKIALNCLHGLLTLTQTSSRPQVVGESVMAMQSILQRLQADCGRPGDLMNVDDPNKVQDRARRRILMLLVNALSHRMSKDHEGADEDDEDAEKAPSKLALLSIKLPAVSTAAAIWMMGESLSMLLPTPTAFGKFDESGRKKLRLEIARLLRRSFPELDESEKEQAVHFAAKLLISRALGVGASTKEGPICEHILAMGRLDVNSDVRDRARYESNLIHVSIGLQHDLEALDNQPLMPRKITPDESRRILLGSKPPPSSLPMEGMFRTDSGESGGFRFGTLSSLVGHRARSAYVPLPSWAEKNSPSSLREPASKQKQEEPKDGWNVNGNQTPSQTHGFYKDAAAASSPSASADDSDESDDESSSDDSASSDEEEEDSSSSDSDDADRENGVLLPLQPNQQVQQQQEIESSIYGSKPEKLINVDDALEDGSDSEDDDDDDDDDDSSDEGVGYGRADPNFLSIPDVNVSQTTDSGRMNNFASSVADDLKGLVLAPITTANVPHQANELDFDRDSSAWTQLARPDHTGGLSVQARYLRGVTLASQAHKLGLTAEKATTVCVQLRFENKKTDQVPFRRICVMQRSGGTSSGGGPSSVIGPRRLVPPAEIDQLRGGDSVDCVVGVDFANVSDRDGSMIARLEIKFGTGSIPVEIKPSIGVMLQPCTRTVDDFDAAVKRLQGFQRVESRFNMLNRSNVASQLLSVAALSPVGTLDWGGTDNDCIRLVGTLPSSSDPVYVLVVCDVAGSGKLVVCCEHALVVSTVMNLLTKSIQSSSD